MGLMPTHEVVDYVGFWKRFVAFLVDSLLINLVLLPFFWVMYGASAFTQSGAASGWEVAVSVIFPLVVTVSFWMKFQATPGKMILKAVIVRSDNWGRPSLMQFVIRWVGYILCFMSFGLGFIWAAIDPKKRGWHDLIARTIVIQKRETVS